MQRFLLTLLLSLILSAPAFAYHAQYEQVISINGENIGTFNVALDGELIRTESELGGLKTILIKNDQGSFSYRPDEKQALKIPETVLPGVVDDLANYEQHLIDQGAEKVGSEKVRGYECDVYTFSEPNTGQKAKAWIWQDKGFPVQLHVESPQGTMVIEFKNIDLDKKPDPSIFTFPDDVEVSDFSAAPAAE